MRDTRSFREAIPSTILNIRTHKNEWEEKTTSELPSMRTGLGER
jgi:hypothetical protein